MKTFVMTMSLLLCKNVSYQFIDKMLVLFDGLKGWDDVAEAEFNTSCPSPMCNNNYI